ncbi:hypothetical protein HNR46_001656 [Haloferula luteola]|uniref:Ribbon-helix-helix protein CopG domain-containing protein n=1 Tax=Haloferula luteola TaxID=595692 RepID=A0A840VBW2_9BACT|nr:hypothetical protein [Haloferula luteola]MBB5351420.1 hypothetical protein [Haloferula luteola]
MSSPKRVSAPLRLDPETLEHVRIAAERTGLAQADILRLCLAIGLEDLRKLNYRIPEVLSDAASRPPGKNLRYSDASTSPSLKVAENPHQD